MTPAPSFLSCPPLEPDAVGACAEMCSGDSGCDAGLKCCSNGCGHSCMRPVSIPYVAPPAACPDHEALPSVCDTTSCEDTGCPEGTLCCENSCGFTVCVEGVQHPTPCQALLDSSSDSTPLFGAYRPQCTAEGLFSAVQYHSHYCWCVDPATGRPQSDMVEVTNRDQLECGEQPASVCSKGRGGEEREGRHYMLHVRVH